MTNAAHAHRRQFIRRAGALALAGIATPALASRPPAAPAEISAEAAAAPSATAGAPSARRLAFQHLHTGERLAVVYAEQDQYLPDALGALNRLLRDHYSGEVGTIAPALFDQLHRLQQLLGNAQPIQVISGYRAPSTNARLRETRGGGVARRSLHMDGRAIDVRIPGVPLGTLRDAALGLRAGGVGYYPREQFVHLDNGPVRRW
jgi:uncharacterized protein YcbK (DUF882 family)